MNGPDDDRRDAVVDSLFRAEGAATPPSGGGPCPDPGILAAMAEGSLLPEERESAEGHLAVCKDCRGVVASLVSEVVPVPEAPAAPVPTRVLPLFGAWRGAAAAVLLLGVALTLATPRFRSGPDTDGVLLASARDLGAARPDLFGGFAPLSRVERLSPPLQPKRGGALALHFPCGTVLDPRPGFRWEEVPGVRTWTVSVLTADGRAIWTAEAPAASLAYPAGREALRPGARYLWEAAGEGPLGRERARRAFTVASAEDRRAWEESLRAVDAAAPPAALLLKAHMALRRGLAHEAKGFAGAFLAEAPGDAVGRETLAHALRLLGEYEAAEAVLPGGHR